MITICLTQTMKDMNPSMEITEQTKLGIMESFGEPLSEETINDTAGPTASENAVLAKILQKYRHARSNINY